MEQSRQQTVQTLTISESAQENFKDFLKTLEDNFQNGVFRTEKLQLIPRDKCAEVHIPLRNQAMIEDFVETLAGRVGANILYAVSLENEKRLKVIAYSMPYSNEMYVISIESKSSSLKMILFTPSNILSPFLDPDFGSFQRIFNMVVSSKKSFQ